MNELKKIITALLLLVTTTATGCIIVDCGIAELTKERPYTFILINKLVSFAKESFINPSYFAKYLKFPL